MGKISHILANFTTIEKFVLVYRMPYYAELNRAL
jgi:hypothetical protein